MSNTEPIMKNNRISYSEGTIPNTAGLPFSLPGAPRVRAAPPSSPPPSYSPPPPPHYYPSPPASPPPPPSCPLCPFSCPWIASAIVTDFWPAFSPWIWTERSAPCDLWTGRVSAL
jgi:hypothetical protein